MPGPSTPPALDVMPTVVGLARTLRAAGVVASPDRVQAFARALDGLDPARRDQVYWAGRLTLCGAREDLDRYDRVFTAYFAGEAPRRARRPPGRITLVAASSSLDLDSGTGPEEEQESTALEVQASRQEILRHKDFSALSDRERAELALLLAAFRLPGESRRSRRWQPAPAGGIDRERTVRRMLVNGGEAARLARRRHRPRLRPVVLIVDVSGSMAPYADGLMRFAHATTRVRARPRGRTEVFTIGTRLTRVTRELGARDPDQAMAALSAAVPDWSGGTRLGEQLKAFLDRWGQRGMARGAVVVVLSDGWEHGDARLLGAQAQRLSRLAHRLVWANPRKGREGYAPLVAGMAAALPHVDDFVEGHSLAALERLAAVVAGASTRGR